MAKPQVVCTCPAYDFPHREGGGKCQMPGFCGNKPVSDNISWEDCLFVTEDIDSKVCDFHHKLWTPEPEETLSAQERNPNFRSW